MKLALLCSNVSIPYGPQFHSQLLHIRSSSLIIDWEKQRKMAQVFEPWTSMVEDPCEALASA